MRSPLPAIRTATEADVPALVALIESAYRGESSRAGWTTEADLLDGQRTDPEGVAAALRAPDARLIVLESPREGGLDACCQLDLREDHAYFGLFAVRPVRQATGLGSVLLAEAERVARDEWCVAELRMKVITARADLIAWYGRRGYRRTGELLPFPYGDERFGLPRRDGLVFEVLAKKLG